MLSLVEANWTKIRKAKKKKKMKALSTNVIVKLTFFYENETFLRSFFGELVCFISHLKETLINLKGRRESLVLSLRHMLC